MDRSSIRCKCLLASRSSRVILKLSRIVISPSNFFVPDSAMQILSCKCFLQFCPLISQTLLPSRIFRHHLGLIVNAQRGDSAAVGDAPSAPAGVAAAAAGSAGGDSVAPAATWAFSVYSSSKRSCLVSSSSPNMSWISWSFWRKESGLSSRARYRRVVVSSCSGSGEHLSANWTQREWSNS